MKFTKPRPTCVRGSVVFVFPKMSRAELKKSKIIKKSTSKSPQKMLN